MTQKWSDEQALGIHICFGSGIFYIASDERFLIDGYIPTLNCASNILVEFNQNETYERIKDAVRRLGNVSYTVVIAHAERYGVLRKIKSIADLKDRLSLLIQINANTVLSQRILPETVVQKSHETRSM